MIELEEVSHLYPDGVRALDRVSLSIGVGEAVGLVGPNGGGKSTLLWHLNGLLRPSSGRIRIGGRDLVDRSAGELALVVGVAFQECDDQLFQTTVAAEVATGAASPEAAAEALDLVGLAARGSRHPGELGYSRRKLLAIAAVMAMATPVVALDEPTTGQDAAGRERVVAVIRRLRELGRTVLVASHDRVLVGSEMDRAITLRAGRVET